MRSFFSITGLLLAAVLFVAVNVVSGSLLSQARIDLTEDGLFTLSEGTRNILAEIPEPITLRLFFSEKLANEVPAFRVYAGRVRELLEEYAHRSDGMIRLEVIDPEPFSTEEDRAVQAGLTGVPLDQETGEQVYFGLVGTNTTDERETIPFFQQNREQFLEYDVTKLVYNLANPDKLVVGILGDVPLEFGPGGVMAAMQGRSQPYIIMNQLQSLFEVRTLDNALTRVDEDVTVLLVARPMTLEPTALYAIDQFVMNGGQAMVFVDPWAESHLGQPGPQGMPNPAEPRQALLPELLGTWGVEVVADKFVADPEFALGIVSGQGSSQRVVPYPAWLNIPERALNKDEVVTGELGDLNIASAGSLRKIDNAAVDFVPLVWTSDRGQLLDVSNLQGDPDPQAMLTKMASSGERHVLAARINGVLKSAFPDGPPPPAEDGDETADGAPDAGELLPHKAETDGPVNLIVVADSDMLEDRYWVRVQDFFGQRVGVPIAANADLLINGLDALAGSNDLISLRSRAGSDRPFETFDELRRRAAQEFLAREQRLQEELRDTEQRLTRLQTRASDGQSTVILSEEEQAEIDRFRGEVLRIRQELRQVQLSLNRDIEQLSTQLKVINIGAMPVAVAFLALVLAGIRQSRRRAQRARD